MSRPGSLIPSNEPQRIQSLAPYLVLGTAPDAVFDELVRLTAKLFNAPIALVSLVEDASVWFKANFGLHGAERVARDQSVCSVAILQEETTVFEDLQREPCHLTDPQVAEALQLRFYAGHPLRTTAGYNIGALCIIDHQPQQVSGPERARLEALAGIVMRCLTCGWRRWNGPRWPRPCGTPFTSASAPRSPASKRCAPWASGKNRQPRTRPGSTYMPLRRRRSSSCRSSAPKSGLLCNK